MTEAKYSMIFGLSLSALLAIMLALNALGLS